MVSNSTGSQITTASLADFVGSLGINTHINSGSGAYANAAAVAASLDYLGIATIRDVFSTAATPSAQYAALAAAGYEFDFVLHGSKDYGQGNWLVTQIAAIDAFGDRFAGSIVAIEGPNEIDNWAVSYQGLSGIDGALALQEDLHALVNADASLSAAQVYGFTLGAAASNITLQAGELAAISDSANLHAYTSTDAAPGSMLAIVLQKLSAAGPQRPVVITESGFTTMTGAPYVGVNEVTQAKYTLALMLDSFSSGVSKTYLYELFDSGADPSGTDPEKHFGLFNLDGSPKLAARAVHNLLAALEADAEAEAGVDSTLAFAFGKTDQQVKSLVLDAGNSSKLVIWSDQRIWDGLSNTTVATPSDAMNVHLNERYDVVRIYDPLVGSAPVKVLYNVQSFSLTLGDRSLVIEVSDGFQPSSGHISGTAAEIVERVGALEHSSNLVSITLTDTHLLPVISVAAMEAIIADHQNVLSLIEGGYGFSIRTSGADYVRTKTYTAAGDLVSTVSDYFKASALTMHHELMADGSSDTVRYTSGVPTSETVRHADGAREEYLLNVEDKSYVTRKESFDAAGKSVAVVYKHADGTLDHTWQRNADGSVVDIRYDARGAITAKWTQDADGSTSSVTYVGGVAKTQVDKLSDGTTTSITYAADGDVATLSTLHADRHRDTFVFDITGKTYTAEHDVFDATGKLVAVYRTQADGDVDYTQTVNTDGSTTTMRFDATSVRTSAMVREADGSSDAVFYSGSVIIRETVVHDDRTRDEYQLNVKNQAYTTRKETYDASGKSVAVVYTHADGTLEHTWQRRADGSIVDIRYDAYGNAISQWVKSASGVETYKTFAAGSDPKTLGLIANPYAVAPTNLLSETLAFGSPIAGDHHPVAGVHDFFV